MYLQVKMPEIKRKNVFKGKQTRNKIPSNIFRDFQDGKIVELMF